MPMRRSLSIRYLLLIANAFIVLVPLFGVVFLRLWDAHLVRVTEEQLIAESVLLAETWRDHLAGGAPGGAAARAADAAAPAPTLERSYRALPPLAPGTRTVAPADTPVWRAGAALAPVVARTARRNGGEVELLDARGCVIAATGMASGACLDELPEVRAALAGDYAAAARQRVEAARTSWGALRRWFGSVQVAIALPVNEDGRVVGVVRMAQPSSSPLEAVWDHRATVLLGLLAVGAFMFGVTHFFSRVISRPVRAITAMAEAVARGNPPQPFARAGLIPAEVHSLSAALDRMTAQLTARAQYAADFAATASHELKTPITGIRGAVELLRDAWDGMPAAQRERFLANIDADAARLQRVVTRLLELARIENAADATETVALQPFLADITERYDGRVVLDAGAAPAALAINPEHLEAAVRNLLDNAVRHGGGQPVDLRAASANGRVVIEVRDHGAGISDGNRGRIFERFFTTERDHGGTGLGLAIVKAVAETRHGSVTFDTGPGGTTFTLTV
jgi:signal transduction histidine kinase